MNETKNNLREDEIDIRSIYHSFKEKWNSFLVLCYGAMLYLLKFWYIILLLIILGLTLGYFSQKDAKPSKIATILVKANFDSGDYLYNSVEQLQLKIDKVDTAYFRTNKINTAILNVNNIEVEPVINFQDITGEYEKADNNLETMVRNLEFEKETKLAEVFNTKYKYHTMIIKMGGYATDATLESIFTYLNSGKLIEDLTNVGRKNLELRIAQNDSTLKQIDIVFDNYRNNESLKSPSNQIFVVDKNIDISQVIEKKIEVMDESEKLRKELVLADQLIMPINKLEVNDAKKTLLKNKMLTYPVTLVFLFMFGSFLLFLFRGFVKIGKQG